MQPSHWRRVACTIHAGRLWAWQHWQCTGLHGVGGAWVDDTRGAAGLRGSNDGLSGAQDVGGRRRPAAGTDQQQQPQQPRQSGRVIGCPCPSARLLPAADASSLTLPVKAGETSEGTSLRCLLWRPWRRGRLRGWLGRGSCSRSHNMGRPAVRSATQRRIAAHACEAIAHVWTLG